MAQMTIDDVLDFQPYSFAKRRGFLYEIVLLDCADGPVDGGHGDRHRGKRRGMEERITVESREQFVGGDRCRCRHHASAQCFTGQEYVGSDALTIHTPPGTEPAQTRLD